MNGFIRFLILSAMIASITSCASTPVEEDLSLDGTEAATESALAEESEQSQESDFSDFEESDTDKQASSEETPSAPTADQAEDEDLAIEDELKQADANQAPAETAPTETPAENAPTEPIAETPVTEPGPTEQTADVPAPESTPVETVEKTSPEEDQFAESPSIDVPTTPQEVAPPTIAETAPAPTVEEPITTITDLKFKANETGGTVIVSAEKPLTFTTRSNPDLHQFIIEIENAKLPERLKRSLNTRDIKGSVGAIDAYQNPGSTTARFVIQLREGVVEPTVQVEGNSLLIVASGSAVAPIAQVEPATEEVAAIGSDSDSDGSSDKILPSRDLSEFLAGNTKFYGKKISIETKNMDIRDALSFITEESGINMVVAEEVRGFVNLKLRQVPWDQALIVIMKAKKLGYTRQGNVLRIAPLDELKAEEDDATKLAQSRRNIEPLKVRMFPVSYAKVEDLERRIKDFLGERGRVVGDSRTNALVITDIEDNLERAAKLIASLDTQPPQVLIEGKIVEAKESFTRSIGVNWGASGAPVKLGSTSRGPVNMNPSFSVNPSGAQGGNFNLNLSIGTLDVLGTLQAALSLSESEEQVKVISAPRIMTLTNEQADITQTTEVAVRQVTQSTTGTQESFQFKPLTMKLQVTPQVTADGSVIMKVNVNRQFQGADTSGAGKGAFAVNSREANTRVLVKNGETAVIGGIYQSDATDGETGVPWFRELPIISYLFKTKNISKEKSELLIFLTPRIVGQINVNGNGSDSVKEF